MLMTIHLKKFVTELFQIMVRMTRAKDNYKSNVVCSRQGVQVIEHEQSSDVPNLLWETEIAPAGQIWEGYRYQN